MKTIVSTALIWILTITFFAGTKIAQAQLFMDFESGSQAIEIANCWGFAEIEYRSQSEDPGFIISGQYSGLTRQLNDPSSDVTWIKTPWIKPSSGNISFRTRLNGMPGNSRSLSISYLPYDPEGSPPFFEGEINTFYTYNYPLPINNNTTIYDIMVSVPHEIVDSENVYKIKVAFYGTGGSARAYIDNMVFPGTYWSETPLCTPLLLIDDTDGDGVPDNEDDYPFDPYKAYDIFYPASGFGSIAFEDLWPAFGDSDFNDLVVDFRINYVLNAEGQLVEMNSKFVIRAIGASQKNSFGFQLNGIPSNTVMNSTGHVLTEGIINNQANGVEVGQSFATFIVIDNTFTKLQPTGGGYTGTNTSPGAPWVIPDTINFNIVFMEEGVAAPGGPIVFSDFITNPKHFNPFIFVNLNRGKEIHLADFPPTDLVDSSYFGTFNDDSKPGQGRYYKSKNNVIWAILIPEKYDYPIERADIMSAHLKFEPWATSNGTLYLDWYKDLPGYRNQDKIY